MEMNDKVDVDTKNAAFAKEGDGCVYCGRPSCPSRKNQKREPQPPKAKSNPAALGGAPIGAVAGAPKFGTERHHLIPVNQAYNRIDAIVAMGAAAGYDINDPDNGMPLPGYMRNKDGSIDYDGYGETPVLKDLLAKRVMCRVRAQWHSGGHSYQPKGEPDESDKSHHIPYDVAVRTRLLDLVDRSRNGAAICKDNDPASAFKDNMREISGEIRCHIEKFKDDKPMECRPYFVSRVAREYARDGKRIL